jgi:ribosomal protein L11 methylase PrmA
MSYKENLDTELTIVQEEDVQMAIPYFDVTPKQVSTGKGFEIPSTDIGNGLKAIDLFCGIGGFKIGLDKLGVKTVFSSDIDKFAQETYHLNFGEKPHGDITKIEAKDIPSFNILTAGFPCQPFSLCRAKSRF